MVNNYADLMVIAGEGVAKMLGYAALTQPTDRCANTTHPITGCPPSLRKVSVPMLVCENPVAANTLST